MDKVQNSLVQEARWFMIDILSDKWLQALVSFFVGAEFCLYKVIPFGKQFNLLAMVAVGVLFGVLLLFRLLQIAVSQLGVGTKLVVGHPSLGGIYRDRQFQSTPENDPCDDVIFIK